MIIYQIINLKTNIKYIGKDKNNNPKYLGSGTDLKKAIKEYGRDNFKKIILEYCSNIEELIQKERYWLQFYNVENNPNFYNKTNKPFGNSGCNEETKNKISKSKLGKPNGDEHNINIGKGRIGLKCKPYKTRKDKGLKHNHTPGIKLGPPTGRKLSEEHKINIKNNRKNCILSKIKPIIQKDLKGNIIKTWVSITEAKNKTGIKGIPNVLTNKAKTAGGYKWEYQK
jgi:hypothetical protein